MSAKTKKEHRQSVERLNKHVSVVQDQLSQWTEEDSSSSPGGGPILQRGFVGGLVLLRKLQYATKSVVPFFVFFWGGAVGSKASKGNVLQFILQLSHMTA